MFHIFYRTLESNLEILTQQAKLTFDLESQYLIGNLSEIVQNIQDEVLSKMPDAQNAILDEEVKKKLTSIGCKVRNETRTIAALMTSLGGKPITGKPMGNFIEEGIFKPEKPIMGKPMGNFTEEGIFKPEKPIMGRPMGNFTEEGIFKPEKPSKPSNGDAVGSLTVINYGQPPKPAEG